MTFSSESSAEDRTVADARSATQARIGIAFVLLVQLRVLALGITVVFDGQVRHEPLSVGILAVVALSSALVLAGWQRLVSRLLDNPALLAFDVLLGYAILAVGGILGPYFLVTVVASGIAGLLYRWRTAALLCLQQTVLYFAALGQADIARGPDGAAPLLLALPVFYPTGVLVGAVLRRLFEEQAAAEEARWRMEGLALAAEERTRLAREMHDSLTNTLAGIALSAKALPLWIRRSPERAETEASRIESAATTASREARALIADLREDIAARPLDEAIRGLADDWAGSSGVPVDTTGSGPADPPPRVRHEAVAVVREALRNVERHAKAARVEIRLAVCEDRFEIRVRDDGRGFTVPPGDAGPDAWLDRLAEDGHYGIVGMDERVRRAGGELQVWSEPGAGTEITISVPARERAAAEAAAPGRRTTTRARRSR